MSEDKKKVIEEEVEEIVVEEKLTEEELDEATGGAEYVKPAKDPEQWKWDPTVISWRMRNN